MARSYHKKGREEQKSEVLDARGYSDDHLEHSVGSTQDYLAVYNHVEFKPTLREFDLFKVPLDILGRPTECP